MSLRDELARIITPTGYTGFEKADRVLGLLRERLIDGRWRVKGCPYPEHAGDALMVLGLPALTREEEGRILDSHKLRQSMGLGGPSGGSA